MIQVGLTSQIIIECNETRVPNGRWCKCTINCLLLIHSLGTYAADPMTLQWRHNGRVGVSDHQPHHCLLNHLFRRRSSKISKPRVTGLCVGNSPVTGEFPAQKASNAKMFPFDDVIMKYALGLLFTCGYMTIPLATGRCDTNFITIFSRQM